jgi:hypothetical protein
MQRICPSTKRAASLARNIAAPTKGSSPETMAQGTGLALYRVHIDPTVDDKHRQGLVSLAGLASKRPEKGERTEP